MSELAHSSEHDTRVAVRSSDAELYHHIYDGELVEDQDVVRYEAPDEDIIDAELVEEPLAIEAGATPEAIPEFKLTFVGQSQDARDFARDRADARLAEELGEGGRFRRFVKGIWKGNIAKDYYRQRYIREAQAQIEESQNILTHESTYEGSRRAMQATIARFQGEYDELIHTETGEHRAEVAADSEVAAGLKKLIRRYANGELSDQALLEERTRTIEAYRETHNDQDFGEGLVRIDNMLDIAQSVRGAVQHGQSLDNILDNMKIIAGESRAGVRTEAHYNMVDRTIEKLGRTRVGSLVGPETVTTAVTVAASLLRLGSHKAVGALAMTVAPGIAGGIFAGLRENRRTKDDRRQHAREMAQGKEYHTGDRRREQMEETRYEAAAAQDLLSAMHERFGSTESLASDDALRAALDQLAALETRIHLSDAQGMDLIAYSAADMVEEERLALDIARAQAKTALQHRLDSETRSRLGIDQQHTLDDMLTERSQAFAEYTENDISDKDRAFRRLKARRVAAAAATGVLTGLVLGTIAQEGIAAMDDTRQGLLEQLWNAQDHPIDGEQHQTLLYGLTHGDNSHELTTHHNPSDHFASFKTGEHANVSMTDDHTLVENHDGTINLVDKNGVPTVEHVPINSDGSLSQASLDTLRQHGMTVEDLSHNVDTVTTETKTVSVDQFVANHHAETTSITRDLSYDNDTPAPVFDRNELGLEWANGTSGAGLETNGDISLNVTHMTPDGSFHGDQSVDWRQAASAGHLKLAVSPSGNSQTSPFMVDIKPDGTINIPHDSPAAKFFSNENGHAVFNGKYAEVVQLTGKDASGIEHVRPLATLVGKDTMRPVTDTVTVHHAQVEHVYKITTNGYDTHEQQATFTEMAPVIPVVSRRSMEAVRRPGFEGRESRAYRYAGRGEISLDEAERLESERSPSLNADPTARLVLGDEVDFYRRLLVSRRGEAYVHDVERDIARTPELASVSNETTSIITIPVAAATEADNIYQTLSLYAQQDRDALRANIVYLHVNWIDDMRADAEKNAAIERTLQEIERARTDFPELRIAVTQTEYARSEVSSGIIGHIARRMVDTTLLSLKKAIDEGRMAADHEMLIVRNDADMNGMGRHYIDQLQQAMTEEQTIDVFTGTTRFGVERYGDLPGFGVVTNIMQMGNILGASSRYNRVHLGGANAGVRASTLAGVGGLGFGDWTGAGSDDVELGQRVAAARSSRLHEDMADAGRYTYGLKVVADRKVLRRVTGATIDTNGDRLESLYRTGRSVIHAWDNYDDDGGYRERTHALNGNEKEDVKSNFKEIAKRIQQNIEGIIQSNDDDVLSRSVLAFSFPEKTYYRFNRDDDGRVQFTLTRAGRSWLRRQLLNDASGRPDPYGEKAMRRLYGVQSTRSRKRPLARESPLVRAA